MSKQSIFFIGKKKKISHFMSPDQHSHTHSVWLIINHGSAGLTECVMKVKKLLVTEKKYITRTT